MKQHYDSDALIGKYLLGEASPEEAMQLEDWRNASPENEAQFQKSAQAIGWREWSQPVDKAWEKVRPQLKTPARVIPLYKRTAFRIAAGIALLFAAAATWLFLREEPEQQLLFATQDQVENVRLSDGTSVRMAKNSTIRLKDGYGTNHRHLQLQGSGYFSVKHDAKKPFVIDAGPLHIKDLGTKFEVENKGDTIFVRVDEGKVMLYDNSGLKITLKATQSAYYVISTGDMEFEIETQVPNGNGKTFVFDNQRLELVVARLNQVYGADVRIASPAVKNCLITTEFTNEPLEFVLEIISETLELSVEKEGTVYWLRGEACTQ